MRNLKSFLIFFVVVSNAIITGNAYSQNTIDWIHTDTLRSPFNISIDDEGYVCVLHPNWAQKYDADGNVQWLIVPERLYNSIPYNGQSSTTNDNGDIFFLMHTQITGLDNYGVRVINYNSEGAQQYDVIRDLFTEDQRAWEGYNLSIWWIIVDDFGNAYLTGSYGCATEFTECVRQATLITVDPTGGISEYRTSSPNNTNSWCGIGSVGKQGHFRVTGKCSPDVLYCVQEDDTSRYATEGILISGAYNGSFEGWTTLITQSCICDGIDRVCDYCGCEYEYDNLIVDAEGNFVANYIYRPFSTGERWCELRKVGPTGSVIWSRQTAYEDRPTDLAWDPFGDILGISNGNLAKYSGTNGEVLWSVPYVGKFIVLNSGNVYTFDANECLTCYDGEIGEQLCQYDAGTDNFFGSSFYLVADDQENLYVAGGNNAGHLTVVKYSTAKILKILDATPEHNPIADTKFWMIRMQNDVPLLTEDTLGLFTTDENGELELTRINCGEFEFEHDLYNGSTSDIISVGDTIKIAKHVHANASIKHAAELGTMFNIHLDNATFTDNGAIIFDTLDNMSEQEIRLNHTEIRYNLLASLQWEAEEAYLQQVQSAFKGMSNFLYDVSDGQIRLDTIMIYDDKVNWSKADMRILASNIETPHCKDEVYGIFQPEANGRWIYLPRAWLDYDPDETRNETAVSHPPDLTNPDNYRTMGHEFGHYALGFDDEYMYWDPDSLSFVADDELKCEDLEGSVYGFMENQYEFAEPNGSEMSSKYTYEDPQCRNTWQYMRSGSDCWNHLEGFFEPVPWGTDQMFVPIIKPDRDDPDERSNLTTHDIFPGPNMSSLDLDYDVGSLVQFPVAITPPAADHGFVDITAHHPTGGDQVDVTLINFPSGVNRRVIEQGRTADDATMYALGVYGLDFEMQAWKYYLPGTITKKSMNGENGSWLYATASAGESKTQISGNHVLVSPNANSITIELVEVQGDYPLIIDGVLQEGTVDLTLTATNPFPDNPDIELMTDDEDYYTYNTTYDALQYSATIAENIGYSGIFTIWAEDDSLSSFFIPCQYTRTRTESPGENLLIAGPGRGIELILDTSNTVLQEIMALTSPYPVIRTGLDQQAIQAGQTHSVSFLPETVLSGGNQLMIRYQDSDLEPGDEYTGVESSLQIYKWDDGSSEWNLLGGVVDTMRNIVGIVFEEGGVYAAFTTEIIMQYECGDASGDGTVNIADASYIINYVFFDGPAPDPIESGDASNDGNTNIADASWIINYIFFGGPAPCESD